MRILKNLFKVISLGFVIVGMFVMNLIGAIICEITE